MYGVEYFGVAPSEVVGGEFITTVAIQLLGEVKTCSRNVVADACHDGIPGREEGVFGHRGSSDAEDIRPGLQCLGVCGQSVLADIESAAVEDVGQGAGGENPRVAARIDISLHRDIRYNSFPFVW